MEPILDIGCNPTSFLSVARSCGCKKGMLINATVRKKRPPNKSESVFSKTRWMVYSEVVSGANSDA